MAKRKEKKLTPARPQLGDNVEILSAGEVLESAITDTLETNYMPYAMSVIVSRALPEIDGFKPAHRKLLYTMYGMGLLKGARTKSANIVGSTMHLNPHGDAAIYDTMVRLSKGYGALLHPFVDSKGNFGKVYSRDMAWAASRYTEAKLAPICAELFRDIDSDTVDFVDNYDNSMKEPALLPTTFPNILVSANQGIAVGMASQLCGFNLGEVCDTTIAFLKNPEVRISETLLAPDFPTGGEVLYDPRAIEDIYNTGRGGVKVRARWRYDKKENLIEIYEIPYTTTTEAIMDKVAELIKAGKVKEISDMRDETDLSGLKLTIDLKRGADPDKLMQKLFKATTLQDTASCNFNVLIGGMPRVMGVRELLDEWCAWRTESVKRRVYFVLKKRQDKLHLLKGLKRILLDIDKAIRIIRETEKEADVVPNLMKGFDIDEIQANFIADIKLRNLNREYILNRISDIEGLQKEIAEMEDILADELRQKAVIIGQLTEIKKKYGQPRRSQIVNDWTQVSTEELNEAENYNARFVLTREGYFKKITFQSLRGNDEQKCKDGDEILNMIDGENRDDLIFFTDHAQLYRAKADDFDTTKASRLTHDGFRALPFNGKMDSDEKPILMNVQNSYPAKENVVFLFANGKGVRVSVSNYEISGNRRRITSAFSDKSPVVAAFYEKEPFELLLVSSDNRGIVIKSSLIPVMSTRTSGGVTLMSLKAGQTVVRASRDLSSLADGSKGLKKLKIPATGVPLK